MILEERIGDLFSYPGKAIGHGVNCEGVMGAGIAAKFKRMWPENYNAYHQMCLADLLQPGQFFGWTKDHFDYNAPTDDRVVVDTLILNLATQDKPGANARLEWIRSSIQKAAFVVPQILPGCQEFAIPRIGCGIGGLRWPAVKMILLAIDSPADFKVVVYSLEGEQ